MLNKIQYCVIDVDGTMTDSGIYYDENGNELKKFSTRDAAGIFAAQKAGIQIIVITGRECNATKRRMTELRVDYLFQNVKNKKVFLLELMREKKICKEQLGYIGDDLNDLSSMELSGFVACPVDSCQEILERADYVSVKKGGDGVVRDVIEFILRKIGKWEQIVNDIYVSGV